MQKTTTPLNKKDLNVSNEVFLDTNKMEPSKATLNNILQFAAGYRVQQIGKNQFVDMFLN